MSADDADDLWNMSLESTDFNGMGASPRRGSGMRQNGSGVGPIIQHAQHAQHAQHIQQAQHASHAQRGKFAHRSQNLPHPQRDAGLSAATIPAYGSSSGGMGMGMGMAQNAAFFHRMQRAVDLAGDESTHQSGKDKVDENNDKGNSHLHDVRFNAGAHEYQSNSFNGYDPNDGLQNRRFFNQYNPRHRNDNDLMNRGANEFDNSRDLPDIDLAKLAANVNNTGNFGCGGGSNNYNSTNHPRNLHYKQGNNRHASTAPSPFGMPPPSLSLLLSSMSGGPLAATGPMSLPMPKSNTALEQQFGRLGSPHPPGAHQLGHLGGGPLPSPSYSSRLANGHMGDRFDASNRTMVDGRAGERERTVTSGGGGGRKSGMASRFAISGNEGDDINHGSNEMEDLTDVFEERQSAVEAAAARGTGIGPGNAHRGKTGTKKNVPEANSATVTPGASASASASSSAATTPATLSVVKPINTRLPSPPSLPGIDTSNTTSKCEVGSMAKHSLASSAAVSSTSSDNPSSKDSGTFTSKSSPLLSSRWSVKSPEQDGKDHPLANSTGSSIGGNQADDHAKIVNAPTNIPTNPNISSKLNSSHLSKKKSPPPPKVGKKILNFSPSLHGVMTAGAMAAAVKASSLASDTTLTMGESHVGKPTSAAIPSVAKNTPTKATASTSVNVSMAKLPTTKAATAKATTTKTTTTKANAAKATIVNATTAKVTTAKATSVKATPSKTTTDKATTAKGTPTKATTVKVPPVQTPPVKIPSSRTSPVKTSLVKTPLVQTTLVKTSTRPAGACSLRKAGDTIATASVATKAAASAASKITSTSATSLASADSSARMVTNTPSNFSRQGTSGKSELSAFNVNDKMPENVGKKHDNNYRNGPHSKYLSSCGSSELQCYDFTRPLADPKVVKAVHDIIALLQLYGPLTYEQLKYNIATQLEEEVERASSKNSITPTKTCVSNSSGPSKAFVPNSRNRKTSGSYIEKQRKQEKLQQVLDVLVELEVIHIVNDDANMHSSGSKGDKVSQSKSKEADETSSKKLEASPPGSSTSPDSFSEVTNHNLTYCFGRGVPRLDIVFPSQLITQIREAGEEVIRMQQRIQILRNVLREDGWSNRQSQEDTKKTESDNTAKEQNTTVVIESNASASTAVSVDEHNNDSGTQKKKRDEEITPHKAARKTLNQLLNLHPEIVHDPVYYAALRMFNVDLSKFDRFRSNKNVKSNGGNGGNSRGSSTKRLPVSSPPGATGGSKKRKKAKTSKAEITNGAGACEVASAPVVPGMPSLPGEASTTRSNPTWV